MTKRALAALALALAALASPPAAQAHGAPAPREIDARVLLDDDGAVAYGGCTEAGCPASAPEGLDVLALDVREAWLGDAPAVVFRLVWQAEAARAGRALVLSLSVDGQVHTFQAASADGTAYASADFARLDGPADVGDGHPKALDAWVPAARLGVAPGATLAGITLTSTLDGEPDDVMPGGWYFQGQEVPHVPHDPAEGVGPAAAGTYAVKGPAPLVTLDPPTALVDLARGGSLTVRVANPLSGLAQAATLTLSAPPGVQARFAGEGNATQLNLGAGATREATVVVGNGSASGGLTLTVATDLGGRAVLPIQVAAPPPPASASSTAGPAKQSPAPAFAAAGLASLAAAGARRRSKATDMTAAASGGGA